MTHKSSQPARRRQSSGLTTEIVREWYAREAVGLGKILRKQEKSGETPVPAFYELLDAVKKQAKNFEFPA